jgi:autophagy-related protein 2
MSWFLSWLSGLPSVEIILPSNIQRRFISFALKKCLERILRQGQLDAHRVDSQIDSGYVQVKGVELDNEVRLLLLFFPMI